MAEAMQAIPCYIPSSFKPQSLSLGKLGSWMMPIWFARTVPASCQSPARGSNHCARYWVDRRAPRTWERGQPFSMQDPVDTVPLNLGACPEILVPQNLSNRIARACGNDPPHQPFIRHNRHVRFDAFILARVNGNRVLEEVQRFSHNARADVGKGRLFFQGKQLPQVDVLLSGLTQPDQFFRKGQVLFPQDPVFVSELKIVRDEPQRVFRCSDHRNGERADRPYLRRIAQRQKEDGDEKIEEKEEVLFKQEDNVYQAPHRRSSEESDTRVHCAALSISCF